MCICVNAHSGPFMQRLAWRNSYTMTIKKLAWENSWHFARQVLVSPRNNVWGTRAEIPYWWRVTTQILVVLLIGRAAGEICFNQSDTLTRSWKWHVNGTEFLRLLPRSHFAGKPVERREMSPVFSSYQETIKFFVGCCCFFPDQFYVSGKLPTYPSPKPSFCSKWEVSVNVSWGEG